MLCRRISCEILPRRQKSLHQECCFDEIAAVVVFPEARNDFPSSAVQEMRECAMESIRLGQEASNLLHSLDSLLAGDEAAIDTDKERQNSMYGGPHCDQIFIARQDFNRHASRRVRALPVISKTAFFNHGEDLFITHCTG